MRVVDASVVMSALLDTGPAGMWAQAQLASDALAAPHLMPVEVASALRRATAAGEIASDIAGMAHADLLELPVDLMPYAPVADRVWELRFSVTAYDAWYVALAEALDAPLSTVDRRLTRAPGPRCAFDVPPDRPSDPNIDGT